MRRLGFFSIVLVLTMVEATAQADESPLTNVHRVVFLGDSITYSGRFCEDVESYIRATQTEIHCEFLNLGLPSETVSGLSENGHAGGAFPRPALDERLDRVLAKTKPDLVVACYGMNDGIYHPYSDERFAKFQAGMRTLHAKAEAAGAKVLHVTPPVFDPTPIRPATLPAGLAAYPKMYDGYDEVLGLYSAWLLAQRGVGWDVLDVHGPMSEYLARRRKTDPKFRLAGDGVHIDDSGHWIIARALLVHWKIAPAAVLDADDPSAVFRALPDGESIRALVAIKQRMLKDTWLTSVGHQRPGMARGVGLDEAATKAKSIDARIEALQNAHPR